MIDRASKLPVKKQCELLDVSRSSFYYKPRDISEKDLAIMKEIDRVHLDYPFYGSRRIRDWLQDHGYSVNIKKVKRLMRKIGVRALYPRRRTSIAEKGHKVYPYLLRNLRITRPNQVWATDITYIPMSHGFLYLVAIMDLYSRKVLSWRFSNTLDTDFCIDALEEALGRYGVPEIFNSDQGCQFTSDSFTRLLKEAGVAISMDGKGSWIDNIFIERLWRSLKWEEVYLKAYDSVRDAKLSIGRWFEFYNKERRHQSLERKKPDEIFYGEFELPMAA